MFNKAMQELVRIAPSWNIRPTLAWLYFKWNKIAVTDGFKIMEVTVPKYDIDDLPTSRTWFKFAQEKEIDFMIPAETIKSIKFPKKSTISEVLNKAYFWNIIKNDDWDIESVWITTNDLEREVNTQTRVIKWKFPEYEKFFENKWTLKIWMNVDHLLDIITVYKKLWHRSLTFTMWDPLEPILINWDEISENTEVKTLLMPLKI